MVNGQLEHSEHVKIPSVLPGPYYERGPHSKLRVDGSTHYQPSTA